MLTPGEILKNRRKTVGKSIFEVSQDTKIMEKYIKQLEANEFNSFDSPVFARGFTKIYAEYLGLDVDRVLALFRRENRELGKAGKQKKKWFIGNIKDIANPKSLVILAAIAIVIGLSAFLYYQFYTYQRTPQLQIYSPVNGLNTNQNQISIEGIASKYSQLKINDKEVETSIGTFKTSVTLAEGENVFNISAINPKNNQKKSNVVLKVLFQKPEVQAESEAPAVLSFNLTLKILDEPSWIKLNIDQKQIFAQTVVANFTKKYTVKNDFELITGKPDSTQLMINGVVKPLNVNSDTGVATLTCKLENSEVICQ
ncbi:helix-turn-helix domain-containing protein [bacterium]|nr:helix-turn-helix domain-containing protein [bacterium]